jgi:pyrroline-5-carboxylate reductase
MTIGFVGSGNMARALAGAIVHSGVATPERVLCSDVRPDALERIRAELGVRVTADNAEVAAASSTVILAVKPKDVPGALAGIASRLAGKTLVSIAAGVSLASLARWAGKGVRIARVMPNTPALVGAGVIAVAFAPDVDARTRAEVRSLLEPAGLFVEVAEKQMDAVTGLSGSGPAYIFVAIAALADGGVKAGLPRDLALRLAARTALGAARMVEETGRNPEELKDMVASPGGTTIAGLSALEEHGFRAALIEAVERAAKRSRELGA